MRRRAAIEAMTIMYCLALQLMSAETMWAQPPGAGRRPVPEAAAVSSSRELVRLAYEKEFEAARRSGEPAALINELLGAVDANRTADTARQYALLIEAEEMAIQCEEVTAALGIVEKRANLFEIDALRLRADTLERLAGPKVSGDAMLMEQAMKTASQAAHAERFDIATDAAALALNIAKSIERAQKADARRQQRRPGENERQAAAGGPPLIKPAQELQARIGDQKKAFNSYRESAEILEKSPEDAEAHQSTGIYLCFVAQKWKQGLPHLAKGTLGELTALAREETELEKAASRDHAKGFALAGKWWNGSEGKETVAGARDSIRRHAATLYHESLPHLTDPLERRLAETRIKDYRPMFDLPGRGSGGQPDLPQVAQPDRPGPKAESLPQELTNSIGMRFRLIPAGAFRMGSHPGNKPHPQALHDVRITKPFYCGVYEVTNAQWKAVMRNMPSLWKDDTHPVECVSWDDVTAFCRRLSDLPEERRAGRVYRLPTEAEWEHACHAGTTTTYSFGNDESKFGDYGWYAGNSDNKTHPVGKKNPNPWGLHDMYGNVGEWCSDWFGDYPIEPVTDPEGPTEGSVRVYRGGRHDGGPRSSAHREGRPVETRGQVFGFRVVLVAPSVVAAPAPQNGSARTAVAETQPVEIDLVPVGHPGNPADANGFGSVAYEYLIGRHEITNEQYCAFLNQVAKTDPHGLYSEQMLTDANVVAIKRLGTDGSYTYRVLDEAPAGHVNAGVKLKPRRPIVCVSWTSAARFCNWLHNGQGNGSTEIGAYALHGVQDRRVPREKDARFFLPTEDEWYKAAYYDAASARSRAAYWKFGTRSNDSPTVWKSLRNARWNAESVELPNIANWGWGGTGWDTLAPVDLFPNSISGYECHCMSGNAAEWVEPKGDIAVREGIVRGGYWWNGAPPPNSEYRVQKAIQTANRDVGFRVAAKRLSDR